MVEKKFPAEFLKAALALAANKQAASLLYVSDAPLPWEELKRKPVRTKIIQATTNAANIEAVSKNSAKGFLLPSLTLSRMERIKLALASAISKELVKEGQIVLCLTGKDEAAPPDTLIMVTIGKEYESKFDYKRLVEGNDISPAVIEAAIALANKIGYEGYEGRPLGTILIVGDSVKVLENSRQITLNPFQGYPESERNLLSPSIVDAIRSFASVDGAFIIRGDGVVLAAGRYLVTPEEMDVEIPMGLGARHAAAALISKFTKAVAIVVSQTSGSVRVFHEGKLILEMKQEHRRS